MRRVLFAMLLAAPHGAFAEAVAFADPTLEAAIRAKIDKGEGPVAAADLLSIVELELISGAIADLSGIEALENLEVLVLVDQHLVDIAPLAGLKKLRALDLASNQIVDIAPLSSLSALTFLSLAFNSVSDLSSLSSLDRLQVLLLDENRVADISPLLGLSMLEQVLLRGNPLNAESLDVHIPLLVEQGVKVLYSPPEDLEMVDESGVRLPVWQPIGPVVEPWQPGVYSLALSPHDPELLYALAQNGLWWSQDGGRQWEKMSLMAKSYGHGNRVDALLVDRLAPSTLYVEDGSLGDPDILKSVDGGHSWQLIENPSAEPCTGGSGLPPNILLASDLQRPDRLYSVSCGALALSDDGGQSWYKPEHNNGGSVRVEGSSPFFFQHPRNEQVLYAGFFHRRISAFLARSDDGGDTWRDRNTIELPLTAMAVDPENEQALFAVSADTLHNSLYNSLDGGLSWQEVAELPIDTARGLVLHPLDVTRMIVWGGSATWQSTDAGQSWERLPIDSIAQLETDPLQAEALWAVTAPGAIHHSTDWGRTWSTIALIDQTRMAESLLVTDDRSLWVGSGQWQDGLFEPSLLISRDQGARWNEQLRAVDNPGLDTSLGFSSPIGFGPIDRLLIDANDPDLVWAHTRYWFMQSKDAGALWTLLALGLEEQRGMGAYTQDIDRQPHIMQKTAGKGAHFLVDPMSPSKNLYRSRDQGQTWQLVQERVSAAMVRGTSLYASVGSRLWHSDNEGDDWQQIAKLPGTSQAYALAVHPRTQEYYMANDLGLLRSSDGGVSWSTLRERGNESWLSVKIRFDPANDDAIYLITGRQLLETTDGGETWVSIGRSLGPMPWFNEVAIDPHNPSLRYVATPHGVFVAGKEGSTAIVETQTVLPEHFSLGQNAPNPFNSSTIIPYEIATAAAAELAIYNVAGQCVRTFILGYQSSGEYRVVWDGRDDGGRKLGSGVYLYALKSGTEVAWRKAILVK